MTNLKLFASVSTLAIGLALSGAAYADQTNSGAGDASGGSTAVTANDNQANLGQGNATGGSTTTTASGNEVASGNSDSSTHNSHSGNSDSSTHNWDTNNNQSRTKTITADNNNNQSRNWNYSDSSTHNKVLTITATVSNQDLDGSVSGVSASVDGRHSGGAATGAIAGSTYTSFAGIQTASLNTGQNSVNQAATSIAANANVTFGSP